MKFVPVVLCLSVFRAAAAESCPDELPGKVELNGAGLALHYGFLETDQALCGKLVSNTEAWVGFAAQPEGVKEMVGAHAIIALPLANTVQQYMLNAKNTEGIVPSENQSLTETSVTQEDGTTVATFKQLLIDDGFELSSNNVYLLAKGFSNDLGYHANRGFVALDFENNVITSPTANPTLQPSLPLQSSSPSLHSSPQPSSQPSQKTSTQSSSKPSSRPSLGSTGAPSSGNFSSTTSPTTTPLVTTNTTSYPSSQPSSVPPSQSTSKPSSRPSIEASSRPSNLPSADPSSQDTSSPSSVPSSQPTNQTLDTSSPSSASSSQLTNDTSSKPSSNPSPEQSVPASISEDNDPTSSSEKKVISMALGAAACFLFATVCC